MRTLLWTLLLSMLPVAAFGLDVEVFAPVLVLVCAVAGLTAPEAIRTDGAATGKDPGRGSRTSRPAGPDRREAAPHRGKANFGLSRNGLTKNSLTKNGLTNAGSPRPLSLSHSRS